MANTYSQITIHVVFAVKHRVNLIQRKHKDELYKYISGIIKNKKWVLGKFQWQEGYGAFSYSHSQRTEVINYIDKQEEHHKKSGFREEYLNILKKFDVKYNDDYLFDFNE